MPNLSRNNLRLYVLYIDPAHLFCNFGMTKIPMIKLRRKPPKSIILVFLDIVISSFLFEIAYCLYGLLRASHSRNLTPYLHTAYTDSYGLLRASHSRNPTQYSHIAKLALRFYAHIVARPKVMKPLLCKHKWFHDFGTLESYIVYHNT